MSGFNGKPMLTRSVGAVGMDSGGGSFQAGSGALRGRGDEQTPGFGILGGFMSRVPAIGWKASRR